MITVTGDPTNYSYSISVYKKIKKSTATPITNDQSSTANRPWSIINRQSSAVNGQWSIVNGHAQSSAINGQWSIVNGHAPSSMVMLNRQWSCSTVNAHPQWSFTIQEPE